MTTCTKCGRELCLMQYGMYTLWGALTSDGTHSLACVDDDGHEPAGPEDLEPTP